MREDKIIDITNVSVKEFKEYMYSFSASVKNIPTTSREAICLKMESIVTAMALKIMQETKNEC